MPQYPAPMLSRHSRIPASADTAGAPALGGSLAPPRLTGRQPLPTEPGQHPRNGRVRIGADDLVTMMIARAEMGQGVASALAAILAEELGARWAQRRVTHAPIDDRYNNLALVLDGLPFHPDDHGLPRCIPSHLSARPMREAGGSGSVVVIAAAPGRAERALRAIEPRWAPGPAAGFSSVALPGDLSRAVEVDDAGLALRRTGDLGAAQARASRIIEARNRAPEHARMARARSPTAASSRPTSTNTGCFASTRRRSSGP